MAWGQWDDGQHDGQLLEHYCSSRRQGEDCYLSAAAKREELLRCRRASDINKDHRYMFKAKAAVAALGITVS